MDHIIYNNSLINNKILGSISPDTFSAKHLLFPDDVLSNTVAVFTDVLRATTTCIALGAVGVAGIVLKLKDYGQEFDFSPPFLPDIQWIYGGEKNGEPIHGFNKEGIRVQGSIGNSPLGVCGSNFQNFNVLFYSSNGARAFQSLSDAKFKELYALCLANIEVTANSIMDSGADRVWLVGSGFYGSLSLEDIIANGALINKLVELGFCKLNEVDDEADVMRYIARNFMTGTKLIPVEIKMKLKDSQVNRLLVNILGENNDLDACIDGSGMEDIWFKMSNTVLVCRNLETKLLITQNYN